MPQPDQDGLWPRVLKRIWAALGPDLIGLATTGLALYIVVRGLFWGYGSDQVAFLIAVLIGLIGMQAVNGAVERRTQLGAIRRAVSGLRSDQTVEAGRVQALSSLLEHVSMQVDGLKVGASASQLLLEEVEVPRERFRRAREIKWSGVTLRTNFRRRLADLEVALAHGARISLLAIDPHAPQLVAELTEREGSRAEYIDGVLKSMILNLEVLAGMVEPGHSFTLGFHQLYPNYGLIIIDPDDDDGLCLVELYHPDPKMQTVFVVHATVDAAWFAFFVRQFDALQARARTCQVDSVAAIETFALKVPD